MLYPEVTSTITESWQAGKWVDEVALNELTPMWADWQQSPDRHFYINEVARTRDGRYLVPRRWIVQNGKEYADAQVASINNQVHPEINRNCAHSSTNSCDQRQRCSFWIRKILSECLQRSWT
jgi:hypothetical protein